MHSEALWSIISTKPVMLYSKKNDAYLVYWCGLAMTRAMALTIAGEQFFKIWATPRMKRQIFEEWKKLYVSDAFKTRAWDGSGHDFIQLYKYYHKTIYTKLHEAGLLATDRREVLGWFDCNNAIATE